MKSSASQPAFSWRHFFIQTLIVGYTERLGSLAVWVRAKRLTKHRNIHHLESFSDTKFKMFQNVQFECLTGALWSREVETLRMEPEPTVQSCSCADATKSQQRSKALISVYNYNYSTKLSKAKSILLFWAYFAHFYQIVIESILSFWVMRLYVVCEFTFMCIIRKLVHSLCTSSDHRDRI